MEEYLLKTYTQKEIEKIINSQTEESINLDFKRAGSLNKNDEKKKEISKDVSAFANSDGGLIIYGIEERNHKASNYSFINGNEITKEWLEQIINSRIQRKIDGLLIDPVRIDNKIEQSIYVVKIPRSLNAPHMTSEKRFYKRYNFESLMMEEYEVRNLYNRQEKTSLKIKEPRIVNLGKSLTDGKFNDFNVSVEFNIKNEGQTIEKLYKLEIKIPKHVVINYHGPQEFFKQHFVRYDGIYSVFSIPNTSPLFQIEDTTIGKVDLKINKNNFQSIVDNNIEIKLFYTNGIDTYNFNLIDKVDYNGKPLTIEEFN